MTAQKVVLVTGASSGIGHAIGEHLVRHGEKVYGGSRTAPEQSTFHWLPLDIRSEQSIQAAVDEVMQREGRIDAVVNNAGLGAAGAFEREPISSINTLFDTNVNGTVRMCQAVLPIMRAQGYGHIINVSSIGSVMGLPFRAFYCASKAATDIMTEGLRMEVKKYGLQVCLLHPGDVNTAINNHRLVSTASDDAVYGAAFEKAYRQICEDVAKGIDPQEFGKAVLKIIHTTKVKRHYYVGYPLQKFSIRLKKLIPDAWFEKIIDSHYKI
jgi:NAD(P)-dependent dehydrogenase (short-subunit alcohol dehydrogenase family)